jgi:serine/threonine protein kinase
MWTSGASRRCATGTTTPWIVDRRGEVMANVDRLEAVIERARAIDVPHVVCHHDLFPHNVLIDRAGRVATLLDWGHAMLAPREHDLFAALCGPDPLCASCAPTARSDSTSPTSSTPGSPARCATLQFASTTRSTWRASTRGASTGCAEWTPTSCSPGHFAIPEQHGELQSSLHACRHQGQLVRDQRPPVCNSRCSAIDNGCYRGWP